jgi:hypothetical protein
MSYLTVNQSYWNAIQRTTESCLKLKRDAQTQKHEPSPHQFFTLLLARFVRIVQGGSSSANYPFMDSDRTHSAVVVSDIWRHFNRENTCYRNNQQNQVSMIGYKKGWIWNDSEWILTRNSPGCSRPSHQASGIHTSHFPPSMWSFPCPPSCYAMLCYAMLDWIGVQPTNMRLRATTDILILPNSGYIILTPGNDTRYSRVGRNPNNGPTRTTFRCFPGVVWCIGRTWQTRTTYSSCSGNDTRYSLIGHDDPRKFPAKTIFGCYSVVRCIESNPTLLVLKDLNKVTSPTFLAALDHFFPLSVILNSYSVPKLPSALIVVPS